MLQSVTRKIIRQSIGRVFFHLKYKPVSVLENTQTYFEQDEYDKLYRYSSARKLKFMYEDILQGKVTEVLAEYARPMTPGEIVVKISGGRLFTDEYNLIAVFNRKNEVIPDVCFNFEEISPGMFDERPISLEAISRHQAIDLPKTVKGTVCSLLTGGAGISHFAHWMLDVLPRIKLVKEAGWFEEVDYFLVPNYKYDFQLETLSQLGIPKEKIINAGKCQHIQAEKLIVTNSPSNPLYLMQHWKLDFLRNMFRSFKQRSTTISNGVKRFYINRRDATEHKILNEEEVIQKMESLGFTPITMSDYTIAERSELFAEAEMVVSIHGAGLMSMLFCPPETKFLEIFNESYVDPFFTEMASQLKVDYNYIICPDHETKNLQTAYEIYDDDVQIDLPLLLDALAKLGIESPEDQRRITFPVSVSSNE